MLDFLPRNIRFRIRIDLCPVTDLAGDCWTWTGPLHQGYGRLNRAPFKTQKAHRVIYQMLVKSLPDRLTLDHLCRNRACVNPQHLEPVSLKENLRRGTGVGVINAAKTICGRGHDLGEGNYYLYGGKRYCKKCQAIRQQAYQERKAKKQEVAA